MKIKVGVLLCVFVSEMLLGNVRLWTTPRLIDADDYWQGVSKIEFEINGWDFWGASPETPIYARIRLDSGAILSQTLVDIESAPSRNQPIRLALLLKGEQDDTLIAPEDAVQIVRWKAGEPEIWLRINFQPMIQRDGEELPPSEETPIFFVMGNTIEGSADFVSQNFETGHANLPFNCLPDGTPVHTFIIVNTDESVLTPDPFHNRLRFDSIAYDYQTHGIATAEYHSQIQTGDATSVSFMGADTLAMVNPNAAEKLRIPHIPAYPSQYLASVQLINLSSEPQPIHLIGFGYDGCSGQSWGSILDPFSATDHPISELFPDGNVSHLNVSKNASCTAILNLKSQGGNAKTSIEFSSKTTKRFLVRRQSFQEETFDGLAAVNLGDFWVEIQFTIYDRFGRQNGTYAPGAFEPMHKQVLLLDDIYRMYPDTHLMVGETLQPVSLIMLHGTNSGIESANLENVPIAMEPIHAVPESPIVRIFDPKLKALLVRHYDVYEKDGEISIEEAMNIYGINCADMGIGSLEGIQHCVNLTSLNCSRNDLRSIPDLSHLTNLASLNCSHNQLTRLPHLPSSLRSLGAGSNLLTKLPDFSRKLRALIAPNNLIDDWGQLYPLPYVTHVEVQNNQLSSFPDLSGYTDLEVLKCENNLLRDLPNVWDIVNGDLRQFFCSGNLFDIDDCADIQAVQDMGINFRWNPQADGRTLNCD